MEIKKIKRALCDYHYFLQKCVRLLSPYIKDDKKYLSLLYRANYGKKLNWDSPQYFAEKMQWLKLNNRNPEYVVMADKVKAKDWVAEKIGNEFIIPTLAVWERAEDVDFDSLPDKFVIKCNHNSGTGMYICKDKSQMDTEKVRAELRKGLNENYYELGREWPYKDIPRRIIAEQFMEDNEHPGDLADYKFFCFNGEPHFCQVIRDRSTKETIDIYDMNWDLMPFVGLNPIARNGLTSVPRPLHLEKMIEICKTLSKGMPFGRIDLYVINDNIYFGEITFFPMNGWGQFSPEDWNLSIGQMIKVD